MHCGGIVAEDETWEEFWTKSQDAASWATSGHVTSIFDIFFTFDKFKIFSFSNKVFI